VLRLSVCSFDTMLSMACSGINVLLSHPLLIGQCDLVAQLTRKAIAKPNQYKEVCCDLLQVCAMMLLVGLRQHPVWCCIQRQAGA
jgi:hypothetical protein